MISNLKFMKKEPACSKTRFKKETDLVLAIAVMLKIPPLGVDTLVKLISQSQDLHPHIILLAIINEQLEVVPHLQCIVVLPLLHLLDDPRDVHGALDLLVVVRQGHPIDGQPENLRGLLVDQLVDHREKLLLN